MNLRDQIMQCALNLCSMRIFLQVSSLVLLCSSISASLFAQEQLGLQVERYSGVNSVYLNPAANTTSPLKWDINLIGVGLFADNDYAYIQDASLIKLLKNRNSNIEYIGDLEGSPDPNTLYADFYDNQRKKSAYVNTKILGPSFMVSMNGRSFGLFTNVRSVTSAQKIPAALGYYELERQLENQEFQIDKFQVASMTWSEIGVNYAQTIFQNNSGEFALGGNIKYLQGYEAAFFKNHESVGVAFTSDDSLQINGGELSFGYATNIDIENGSYDFQRNGSGFGFDLGFTYTNSYDDGSYKWKIGASILDAGQIKFKKRAALHTVNTNDLYNIVLSEFESVTSEEDLFELISSQALSDSTASFSSNSFSIALPTALSVQADVSLTDNIYVNASLVRRISFGKPMLKRANMFAVTPRFEKRWFGVSVPLVLYDDRNFHLGTSLRLGPLTLGSDNLLSIVKEQQQFTGSDFYVALKINPFELSKRNRSGGQYQNNAKRGDVKCYKW